MLKGTVTERRKIRGCIYSGAATVQIGENEDGSWFLDVYDVQIEAETPAALLRELALILEEI